MKILGTILIVIALLLTPLSAWKWWKERTFTKASTTVKANVHSVEIKPFSGKAMVSLQFAISYTRDGEMVDTTYKTTEAYSTTNPIPSEQKLLAKPIYVTYVPKDRKAKTYYSDRIILSEESRSQGYQGIPYLGNILSLLIIGYLLRRFGSARKV